jgi:hypothetical protein
MDRNNDEEQPQSGHSDQYPLSTQPPTPYPIADQDVPQTESPQQPTTSVNNTYTSPQPTYPVQSFQPIRKSRKKILFIVLIAMIISASAVFAFIFSKNADSELTKFNDPNFSMLIPESWSGDAGYEPGQTLIFYYSPEDASDANREKAYSMIVYVGSQEDRIESQIESLKASGASYSIEANETFENNGVTVTYTELVISSKESPDNEIRVASSTTKGGDFVINADISGLNKHWSLHKNVVPNILKSIVPACNNPNLELAETSSVVNLCE